MGNYFKQLLEDPDLLKVLDKMERAAEDRLTKRMEDFVRLLLQPDKANLRPDGRFSYIYVNPNNPDQKFEWFDSCGKILISEYGKNEWRPISGDDWRIVQHLANNGIDRNIITRFIDLAKRG